MAFALSGAALMFAAIGWLTGYFDAAFLAALPERVFGVMTNETLIAVPLFILMGVLLEKSKISESLLENMAQLMGGLRGGLGVSVCLVGMLLAASTGIVGATVVTMGLISLPAMLKRKYSPELATGIICASGTLGQIIPPSIILIILGDVMSSAHQQAQLAAGNYAPTSISVADLFVGAIVPGGLLVLLYILYVLFISFIKPEKAPAIPESEREKIFTKSFLKQLGSCLFPPLILIVGVLGAILTGIATPTEAASVGCVAAFVLARFKKQMSFSVLKEVIRSTAIINTMVFTILIGASIFSLVFRGFGGDDVVREFLMGFEGGVVTSFLIVMLVMFLMGFFLDFFEITFVVVPIVGPVLLQMGLDPLWLGIMIALNLQTSFLTPPFGFSLFYLRGVTPAEVTTGQMYRGVVPFIAIQLV